MISPQNPRAKRSRRALCECLEPRACRAASSELTGPALAGDLDNNGRVDLSDFNTVRRTFGNIGDAAIGDANKDDKVDLRDFLIVRSSLGSVELRASIFLSDQQRINSPLTSADVLFNTRINSFPLSALQLDASSDNQGSLLTAANTPQRKLNRDGSWDGFTWTIPNLWKPTLRVGAYTLSLRLDFVSVEQSTLRAPSDPLVKRSFVRSAEIPNSDNMMRIIVNSSEKYWDHELYSNLNEEDGKSNIALGTFISYGPLTNSRYDASADPVNGKSADPRKEDASKAYQRLFEIYKQEQPNAVVAGYVGWQSVKSKDSMRALGIWPSDNLLMDDFRSSDILPPLASSPTADGRVDLFSPTGQEALFRAHLETALGLNGRPRNDMIQFDEVGYVYQEWDNTVQLLTRLKAALSEHGVLVGINLGGWGWVKPFFFGPKILEELPKMADSITIENLWNRSAPGGVSFRSVDSTQAIINNLRSMLSQGIAINLLATTQAVNANQLNIVSVREVETRPYLVNNNNPLDENLTTALRVTTDKPHHIFPLGGAPFDHFGFKGLPGPYSGLQNNGWTAVPVPGQPNQVDLYNRYERLEVLKSRAGITGSIAYRGGQAGFELVDSQSVQRLLAGLTMMVRNRGDRINIAYSPGQVLPGNGDPTNKENWIYWPQQYGEALEDYVIDSVNAETGVITKMHRAFEGGIIEVYPEAGYVVSLPNTGSGSQTSAMSVAGFQRAFVEVTSPLVSDVALSAFESDGFSADSKDRPVDATSAPPTEEISPSRLNFIGSTLSTNADATPGVIVSSLTAESTADSENSEMLALAQIAAALSDEAPLHWDLYSAR